MRLELPLKTVCMLNAREHLRDLRVTAKRQKTHRECARPMVRGKTPPPLPLTVTPTRVSAGVLDAHDDP